MIKFVQKTITYAFIFLCSTFFWSCAPRVAVNSSYDKSVNFSRFKTYNWYQDAPIAGKGEGVLNQVLDSKIRSAIESALRAKGFTRSSASPDLLVAYDVAVNIETYERPGAYSYNPGFGYSYGHWYGYRYDYNYNRIPNYTAVNRYKEGTILIDFVEPQSKDLIWRGWGETVIYNNDMSQSEINAIVNNILAKYPPK